MNDLPKVLRDPQSFNISKSKSSSRYSLGHILRTSSSKSAPRPPVALTFPNGNVALARISCTFCRTHLPKVLRNPQCLHIFNWKSSSRYSPVLLLSTTFPNRAAHPPAETETLLRARECFQPEFTVPNLSHLPTTCRMMWLP